MPASKSATLIENAIHVKDWQPAGCRCFIGKSVLGSGALVRQFEAPGRPQIAFLRLKPSVILVALAAGSRVYTHCAMTIYFITALSTHRSGRLLLSSRRSITAHKEQNFSGLLWKPRRATESETHLPSQRLQKSLCQKASGCARHNLSAKS
jgi:hypothetical protein